MKSSRPGSIKPDRLRGLALRRAGPQTTGKGGEFTSHDQLPHRCIWSSRSWTSLQDKIGRSQQPCGSKTGVLLKSTYRMFSNSSSVDRRTVQGCSCEAAVKLQLQQPRIAPAGQAPQAACSRLCTRHKTTGPRRAGQGSKFKV